VGAANPGELVFEDADSQGRLIMAHESILFGFIRGSRFTNDNGQYFRELQIRNTRVISALPARDSYPYLSRGMFGLPPLDNTSVTFRTQIIHFGGSINYLEFGDVPEWLEKFENLLRKLFWYSAEAHIITDVIGVHRFTWQADQDLFATYWTGDPQPTTRWTRKQFGDSEPIVK
jgi:hypothetical protein